MGAIFLRGIPQKIRPAPFILVADLFRRITPLPHPPPAPNLANVMDTPPSSRRRQRSPHMRLILFSLGAAMVVISPIIGVLPGPGGLILFPLGLMLCLQNSHWAKRRYVRFKNRHPKYGAWTDKVMRRPTAARRNVTDQMKSKQMESLRHDN